MKLPAIILLTALTVTADAQNAEAPASKPAAAEKKAAAPVIKRLPSLDDCPEAVRAAVKAAGHDKGLTEINVVDRGGVKTYTFETGTEDNGRDQEINYTYSAAGVLLRTEKDMPLKSAPEAVQAALQKLAGTTAVVDDVEEVTEGKIISYKAELESNGGADRKVRVSAAGEVLELEEETDD